MTKRTYTVGFGKPPAETQFKKGQSGNPAGRKKGSKNLSTMVQAALEERVAVNANGKRKTISKLEAAFAQQANRAAGGDPKATKLMIDILLGAQVRESAQAHGETISPDARRYADAKILQALKARLRSGGDEA
jgi:hypothetical protein